MKIFVFHRVHPEQDPLWPALRPERFREQIAMIRRSYEVVPLEDFILSGERRRDDRRIAAIAFDDAYRDFVDYALPILAEQGLPCSMYVVTSCADTGDPIWTYRFDHALLHTRRFAIEIKPGLLPPDIVTRWAGESERLACARAVKASLKQLEHAERELALAQIFASLDDVAPPRGMMMSWDDLRQARTAGVEIGSHSVTHPLLATMRDEGRIFDELSRSRARIEVELGIAPRAIAYPNGSHNACVRDAAACAGYLLGLTSDHRPYRMDRDDRFAVPRIELYDEPSWKARARIGGLIQVAKRVRNAIRV